MEDKAKESPETYTLYLVSGGPTQDNSHFYPIQNPSLNNITWVVDYDSLFKGRQMLYEYCRVRFTIITTNVSASITWNSNYGYITSNLPSSYNANTTVGTILGTIYARTTPMATYTNPCILVDGRNDIGVDINHKGLVGVQLLNIQLINAQNGLMTIPGGFNYMLELSFELYN